MCALLISRDTSYGLAIDLWLVGEVLLGGDRPPRILHEIFWWAVGPIILKDPLDLHVKRDSQ